MTVAYLNAVGNLPSVKERLAMCAIISEKNGFTAYNEGGEYYIHGGWLSRSGTENPADLIGCYWGQRRAQGHDGVQKTDQYAQTQKKTRDMSLTDSRSLTILSTKLRANVQQRLWFSSSVLVLSVSLECSSSLTIFQRCLWSEPASWIRWRQWLSLDSLVSKSCTM